MREAAHVPDGIRYYGLAGGLTEASGCRHQNE
jgi:hypothetical protein